MPNTNSNAPTPRRAPRAIQNLTLCLSETLKNAPVKFDEQGLCIDSKATEDNLKNIVCDMSAATSQITLYLRICYGDAYNALTSNPSRRKVREAWAKERFGESIQNLWKCARVAREFPHGTRDMTLTWSQYETMAGGRLTPEQKEGMLAFCQQKRPSTKALKEEIQRVTGRADEKAPHDPETWIEFMEEYCRPDMDFIWESGETHRIMKAVREVAVEIKKTRVFGSGDDPFDGTDEDLEESVAPDHSDEVLRVKSFDNKTFLPAKPCSQACSEPPHVTENADIRSAWEGDTHSPKHSSPPSSPPRASGSTESEKSDNKKEDSYCQISGLAAGADPCAFFGMAEEPHGPVDGGGFLPYDALLTLLAGIGFGFKRDGEIVLLYDPDDDPERKRDPAFVLAPEVLAAVNRYTVRLLALCDLQATASRLYERLRILENSDPPKASRAQALRWLDDQIERLAAESVAYGGTENGWDNPSDPYADDEVAALRSKRRTLPETLLPEMSDLPAPARGGAAQ